MKSKTFSFPLRAVSSNTLTAWGLAFVLALGYSAVQAAENKAALPDAAAGEKIFTASCASCHGADGNSSIAENPKLAGQHPSYLEKQLREFKNKARASAVMGGMVAALSDADMANIAAWLGKQTPKTGFAKDAANVQFGERIYRGGIADRKIAACAGCHSPNGAGIPAQYPRLSGQQSVYTENQLKAFRDKLRGNNQVMTDVAAKMNDREIKAVADYIAGLR